MENDDPKESHRPRNPIIADADTGHGGITATMKYLGDAVVVRGTVQASEL